MHVAFADASSYARVIPELAAAGLKVVAPAVPHRSMVDDAAYILGRAPLITGDGAAIPALTRAYETYAQAGAGFGADRVRAVLGRALIRSNRRTAARPRPTQDWDALAASERKVARLVAAWHTNRSAAAALFVLPHTVNTISRRSSASSRSAPGSS
ncbi:hypothetical protein ACF08M_29660 [Streptomyces sp. NPDC015032]|uniref:hypothetical protein n=1 Tax=Streptomyces sp. NPDC015032 TaxID=3364937 RepID=UPI0036FF370F